VESPGDPAQESGGRVFSLLYRNSQAAYNKIFLYPALKIEPVRTVILKLGDNIQTNITGRFIVEYTKS
jgi:hypothetical protein